MKYNATNILGTLEGAYKPVSNAPKLNTNVPDSMDTEIHKILNQLKEKFGDIDEFVRRRLAYPDKATLYKSLSAEQIDAVALAIYNIEFKGEGLIVADQTGIGKGRVAASILRYAHLIGKKPIFLTIKSDLFSDIYRDLNAIGMDDLVPIKEPERNPDGSIKVRYITTTDKETGEEIVREREPKYYEVEHSFIGKKRFVPFILNNDVRIKDAQGNIIYESCKKQDLERIEELEKAEMFDLDEYDVILATYSQFNSKNNKILSLSKQEWLKQVARDNIIVMDESHTAAGKVPPNMDKNKVNQAKFFRDLLPDVKGVVYLSATYAKFPENMVIYYFHTAMNKAGLDPNDFIEVVKKGGVALQEIISAQLVESGNLIRRERPLSNVKFEFRILSEYSEKHREIFDRFTDILREIIMFQRDKVKDYIKVLEKQASTWDEYHENRSSDLGFKYSSVPIFSALFQIVNQLVFALKAKGIGKLAVKFIREGKKPVITFQNTMEALIKDVKEIYQSNLIDVDYKQVLYKALSKTLSFHVKDEMTGKNEHRQIDIDAQDVPEEIRETYNRIRKLIDDIEVGISISPLDVIREEIEKAGYKVGEITKRKIRVNHLKDGIHGKVVSRKIESATDIARKFNNNEIDAVLLNESGSTGISLHAVETKKIKKSQVKPRVMIMAQPPLDINQFIQMLGRVNRSGQVLKPEYNIISLDVPAETRLMIMLQKKLRSLDANVSSNQKNSKTVLDVPDFFNKYGGDIVINWLMENDDVAEILGNPQFDNEGNIKLNSEEVARQASGRIAILPTKLQEKFYDEVISEYTKLRKEMIMRGEWDLEVSSLPLDAQILEYAVISKGENPETPFGGDTVMLKCDVKNISKPLKKAEIEKMSKGYEKDKDLLLNQLEKELKTREKLIIDKINNKYDKIINELINDKKKDKSEIEKAIEQLQNERNQLLDEKVKDLRSSYLYAKKVFSFFKPLQGYEVPTGDKITDDAGNTFDEFADAIFLGYKFGSAINKFTPSNITLRFVLAHPKRYIDWKLTEKFHKYIEAVSHKSADMLEYWDDIIQNQTNAREIRYIIVGNIIGAIKRYKGQLANIEFADGTQRKALLLPRNFKGEMKISVPILKALPIIKDLPIGSAVSSDTAINKSDGIRIIRIDEDVFELQLPSSKAKASQYYSNNELTKCLIGGEFEKKAGSRWKGRFYESWLHSVLTILNNYSVKIFLFNSQMEKLAQEEGSKEEQLSPLFKIFLKAMQLHKLKKAS